MTNQDEKYGIKNEFQNNFRFLAEKRDTKDEPSAGYVDPHTGRFFSYKSLFDPEGCTPLPMFSDRWMDINDSVNLQGKGVVTFNGYISLQLRDKLRVDITVDKAIRVINVKNNTILAISENGASAALIHPNGRIYQYGSRVEIVANDLLEGNNKYAKMWYKGVAFTSEESALTFLVDSAGTRSTNENFTDMTQDFSLAVFFGNSTYGSSRIMDAINMLDSSQYWKTEDGTEHWIINNLRITQAADGLLRITRSSNKYQLRTSPTNGTANLTTPFVHATASLGSTSHLFVRRGERRMHFDGSSFIVRNAGHSAGFDDKNYLKVY